MWFSYVQTLRIVPKLAKGHTPASSSPSQPLLRGCRRPFQHRVQVSSANRIHFCEWLSPDGNYCCSVTKKQKNLSESEVFFRRWVWRRPRYLSPFKICQTLSGRASFAKPVCVAQCTEFSHAQVVATHWQIDFSQTIGVGQKDPN